MVWFIIGVFDFKIMAWEKIIWLIDTMINHTIAYSNIQVLYCTGSKWH